MKLVNCKIIELDVYAQMSKYVDLGSGVMSLVHRKIMQLVEPVVPFGVGDHICEQIKEDRENEFSI